MGGKKRSKIENRLGYIFRFLYKGTVLAEPLEVARRTPGFPRNSLKSAVVAHIIFNLGMIYLQIAIFIKTLCIFIIITYLITYLLYLLTYILTNSRHAAQSLRS
jgi:hypothetical protein